MPFARGQRLSRSPSVGCREDAIKPCIISNQCGKFEHETEVANSLLARDYKGFGNQSMNGVIENK